MSVDFAFFVEDDRIRVKFVTARQLGKLATGHLSGGDYGDLLIRLPRFELRRSQRSAMMHELGHYLYARTEMTVKDSNEEAVVDLLAWVPSILVDPRNVDLRRFLGLGG